jgi:PAS domain S-box-containing protein
MPDGSVKFLRGFLADGQRISHTGSWGWNLSTGKIIWSEEHFRIFGFNPEKAEPSLQLFLETVHPEDRSFIERGLHKAIREGSGFDMEFRIALADGSIKNVRGVGRPVLTQSGDITHYIGTTVDITARKRAEALLAGEKRLLEMIAKGNSLSMILDALCRLVEDLSKGSLFDSAVGSGWRSPLTMDQVNRAIQRTNNLEQMMSDVLDAVLSIFNCDRAWLVYPCDPEAATWSVPMEHTRPKFPGAFALGLDLPVDAAIAKVFRTVRAASSPVRFGPGTEHSLPAEATKRFSIQYRVLRHQALLGPFALGDVLHSAHVTRVATLGEMTASIAHEINQPLTAVVTNGTAGLRWLAAPTPNLDEARSALKRTIRDAKRAGDVIAQIRALVKKSALTKAQLNLSEMIQEVLAITNPEARQHRVWARTELTPGLPPVQG